MEEKKASMWKKVSCSFGETISPILAGEGGGMEEGDGGGVCPPAIPYKWPAIKARSNVFFNARHARYLKTLDTHNTATAWNNALLALEKGNLRHGAILFIFFSHFLCPDIVATFFFKTFDDHNFV